MKLKLISSIVLVALLLSTTSLAECFLYPDNNLYCTDVLLEQAQQQCALYTGCNPLQDISSQSCQTHSVCQQNLILNLPLPVINQPGEIVDLPVLKNSIEVKEEPYIPVYVWIILILIIIIAATYYSISRNLIPPLKSTRKIKAVGEEPLALPVPLNLGYQPKSLVGSNHQHHAKKVRDYQIKQFLAEYGLAAEETTKDVFHQLIKINKIYEKRKQKLAKALSQQEQKTFEDLQQVVDWSKGVRSGVKMGASSYLDIWRELRKLAFKK